ncbi:MAG: hypothetical protein CM15mV68_400 [uncultured marine virus]|nr:MAG: hypothetical protein CM15mV68_400 [uncultured marine virus]
MYQEVTNLYLVNSGQASVAGKGKGLQPKNIR